MNRELAETVVRCLGFSGENPDAKELRKFHTRDWRRTFNWLDSSGLTLYLLRRLKSVGALGMLPPPASARFERNLADNQRRVDYLAAEFGSINERLDRAGLNYAVIKGFSLVPLYCPDAVLRTPSDLDYLVDKSCLAAAQSILEEAGYRLERVSEIEFKFRRPSPRIPTVSDDPYAHDTKPLVELHLTFWNPANRVPLSEPVFRLDQTIGHDWHGFHFPALKDEDAFILQILHVFQHTLEGWVKLSWLLEIGCFLRTRSSDTQFWNRVDASMQRAPCVTEFAAVVLGLAERVFAAPLPPVAATWTESLRPAAKLWLDNYGQRWAIGEHPYHGLSLSSRAKLTVFLHREFIPDRKVQKEISQQRLFPWKRPEQIAVANDQTATTVLTARRLQWQFVLQRLFFHLGSSTQYLLEVQRWRQLNHHSASHGSPRQP